MSESQQRPCAFPGCQVLIAPAPERGGPAPGYCDDPDHNAHSVYRALKRGEGEASPDTAARLGLPASQKGLTMAEALYRAAFIRMHPTGKVVLSLSEAAQNERKTEELAGTVAAELGIPPEDVKVVHEDDDRFGEGNSFNSAPSDDVGDAVAATARKLRETAQIVAGAMLQVQPDSLSYENGRWTAAGNADGVRIQEVAARAFGAFEMPDGFDGSMDAQTTYRVGAGQPAS